MNCLARRTASLPEIVHSERIPTCASIFVTLSQVLKSSSTRAFSPSNFLDLFHTASFRLEAQGQTDQNSVSLSCSVWTPMVPPIISMMFLEKDMLRSVSFTRISYRSLPSGGIMELRHTDGYRATGRCKLDGVGQQAQRHLIQPGLAAEHILIRDNHISAWLFLNSSARFVTCSPIL